MAEQVNPPSTEAGPTATDRLRAHVAEVGGRVWLEQALEQARAEGRQQAVREIREGLPGYMDDLNTEERKGYGFAVDQFSAILDRVAGLNASEQPPPEHEALYVDDGGDGYLACHCGYGHVLGDDALVDHIHDERRDASESDDTTTLACGCVIDQNQLLISCSAEHAPDYQPPEASDE